MRSCQVWECLLHALSVVVDTPIFTKTQHVFHVGLCRHYRQLFGMFGRSTCEKVTDSSMLLLLGLGWYRTAHRVALLQWTTEVLFGGSYFRRVKIIVKWVDKEPINPEEGGMHPHIPSPCRLRFYLNLTRRRTRKNILFIVFGDCPIICTTVITLAVISTSYSTTNRYSLCEVTTSHKTKLHAWLIFFIQCLYS